MMTAQKATKRLASDLRSVIQDAEELLGATAGKAGDRIGEIRHRLSGIADTARASCQTVGERTAATAKATDRCVRDHPYETVALAFGLGLLLGMLFRRD